jgi:hypothetical protein
MFDAIEARFSGKSSAGREETKRRISQMFNRVLSLTAAAVLAASVASFTSATAAPVVDALAIKNAAAIDVEQVQWRGFGWGFGAGLLGGAIIGGALARPYYYGPGPYYYGPPGPYYYGPPAPAYAPPPPGPGPGNPVAYCSARYKSYDPASGTFLGYDGVRHPCP